MGFQLGRKHVRKGGENEGYQHFILYPQCLTQLSHTRSLTLSQTSPDFYVSAVQVLLVTSNFSLSHSVCKRLVLQTRKNLRLFGKGLRNSVDYWLTVLSFNIVVSSFIFLVRHKA